MNVDIYITWTTQGTQGEIYVMWNIKKGKPTWETGKFKK